jgi:hypothetical protein
MSESVTETRRYKLEYVAITPTDIRQIADIITEVAEQMKKSDLRVSLTFSARAFDDSKYESGSGGIFDQGGILETKQIRGIEISLSAYPAASRISVELIHTHSEDSPWNHVTVTGTDSTWVNGVMRRLEDAIGCWEVQPKWPRRFRWLSVLLFTAGIGRLFLFVLLSTFSYVLQTDTRPVFADWEIYSGLWGVILPLAIWPAMTLTDKLVELWPVVEIRAGREHAQNPARRRKQIWAVITLLVLPLLLNTVYDIIRLSLTQ